MIVGEPHLREARGEVTVEAAVALERPGAARPLTLWFTFPSRVGSFVTTRADGFAAALLPLAMQLGEDLTVHGDLSCRLARGLREYQRYQATWKPDVFSAVELTPGRWRSGNRPRRQARSGLPSPAGSTRSTRSSLTSATASPSLPAGSRTA